MVLKVALTRLWFGFSHHTKMDIYYFFRQMKILYLFFNLDFKPGVRRKCWFSDLVKKILIAKTEPDVGTVFF